MAGVLDNELWKYWRSLSESQKKSIISMIKSFIQPSAKKGRVSIKQYNKEIDEAMERMNAGEFISHQKAVDEMKKW